MQVCICVKFSVAQKKDKIYKEKCKMIAPGVDDVKISLQRFGWPDYVVFLLMLLSCIAIGIYFGFIEKKSKKPSDEEADYLVGGRTMGVFPISMSLIARLQSHSFSIFILKKLRISEMCFFFLLFLVLYRAYHCWARPQKFMFTEHNTCLCLSALYRWVWQ